MSDLELRAWVDEQWRLFLEEPADGTQRPIRNRGRKAAQLTKTMRGLSRFRRLLE